MYIIYIIYVYFFHKQAIISKSVYIRQSITENHPEMFLLNHDSGRFGMTKRNNSFEGSDEIYQ